MHKRSKFVRFGLAGIAAALLLTGMLNLRSVIGSSDGGEWEIDPSAPSQIDRLVGTSERVSGDLDASIISLQDELRAHPDNNDAATLLGHAYLQKSRESGDPSYYPMAEALFTSAFNNNDEDFSAATGLGTVALAKHQFSDALTWGQRAKEINPYFSGAYGVIGDALIELGRYDEAVVAIQEMVDLRPDLASYSRVSYIRELMGDVPGAIDAMERAAEAGAGRAEHVAWTHAQIGNLLFNSGDLDGAERRYESALLTLEGYVYGTAGMARVAAARGDFETAIAGYSDAIQRIPLPEFVIALGEVYLASGQPNEADQQFALVRAMIELYEANGVDSDMELALFEADHGADPSVAVGHARSGYEQRPGIKSADVLAWALFKSGDLESARAYSLEARRLGTDDALMYFHAAMIEQALGNLSESNALFARALEINPHFSIIYVSQAHEAITS